MSRSLVGTEGAGQQEPGAEQGARRPGHGRLAPFTYVTALKAGPTAPP
ncbi:hypothetical protein ACWF9B_01750 [Streptomyces sp. NPDC055089]